jgi:ABC-type Mn2+/Zn2+ transport system ATPase subunit/ABC-type Mn2+/Zn2+ transport system permease subunit
VNGSGKSTLFKAIMGFVRLARGEIRVLGMPVAEALRKNLVAYVPQAEEVDWNFPVLVEDVVMMGRYGHMNMMRIPRAADREAVSAALARVNMSEYRKRQIGELSGGQKKRVFLARALAQDGRVILLDEPFTGVDVKTEDAIIDLLRALRDEGRVMLVSTHNLGSVPEFCDRTVLLKNTVLAYGPTQETFTQANLERLLAACCAISCLAVQACMTMTIAAGRVLTDDERPLVFYGEHGDMQHKRNGKGRQMIELLAEPFTYRLHAQRHVGVGAGRRAVCAFLSCYLMLKGWSLIGDALSHSIVPGVAGAYMLGLPFSIGAFFSGGLAAAAMLFLNQRTKLKEDAIIGLIFSSFFGLGLFMVSLSPTSVNIQTIVLGNILAITPEDTLQLAVIGFVSLAMLLVKWKDLMVVFFDESHARSIGLNPTALKVMFFTLLSASTVAAMQTVGAFLVICMVVTPGATAYLLTDRFPRLLSSPSPSARHQLRRRLCQLFPRRRDRRHHRRPADRDLPDRLLLRAQARHARGPPAGPAGAGDAS